MIVNTIWGKLKIAEVDLEKGFTAKDLLEDDIRFIQDEIIGGDIPFDGLHTELQVFDTSSEEVCWVNLKNDYPEVLAEILAEVPHKAKEEWEDIFGDYDKWLEWFKEEYKEFIDKYLEEK